jgi:serine/threonine protein kinase/Flp pilus assembly protein TadD
MKCPKCQIDHPDSQTHCALCGTKLVPDKPENEKAPPQEKISVPPTETFKAPKEELTTGSTFAGRYQIIEELGKGGMGRVYKALDKEIKEKIALKLIKPEIGSDATTIERFRNELKLARQISHKNVCRMYDLNKDANSFYITMEYVSGEDLKSFIRRAESLGAAKATFIAKQVCKGLEEAHRLGVIHRDLKPQNIMIDQEGNAKIMDFGIARSLKTKGITGSGVMIGTPEYMSPEQAEGKDVDQRSDIYSLGVILYEMVTGRVPFEGDTPFAIGMKHKSEAPKPPKEINAQIPDSLNRLILRCLVKDRERRYDSAGELLVELEAVEKSLPTTEKPIPTKVATPEEEITVTGKKRWVLIAVPLLLIALAVIVYFLFIKEKDILPPGRKTLAVIPFENLGPPEDEYFADGITNEIRSRLAALHGLDVISSASSNVYKKTQKSILQIREELGIDYVLSGTAQWSRDAADQNRMLVMAELVRTLDDTLVWTERYERPIQDVLKIQSEISEDVAKRLDIKLLEPERSALEAKPTDHFEAYDYYLRAIGHHTKTFSLTSFDEGKKAVGMYEKAIELDPDFVQAYVRLSTIHSYVYHSGWDRTKERLEKAKAAVDQAIELDPDLPEAQEALGWYYYRGRLDYDRALEIFENFQKTRPNNPSPLLSYIQRRKGQWEESLENLEKVFKLNPRSFDTAINIGISYMSLHRYEEAEVWFNRALSLNPEAFFAKYQKTRKHLLGRGDLTEARAILDTMTSSPYTDMLWTTLLLAEKNFSEAIQRLNSLDYDSFEAHHIFFNKELSLAAVYHAQRRRSQKRAHADLARIRLEQLVQDHPEDPRYHSSLGLAYAYLERGDDALREGNQAVDLYPVSQDAFQGPVYEINLAKIYALTGDYENVADKLDYLLSIPAGNNISIQSLRLDPIWDPMRDNPRFIELIDKYLIPSL